MYIPFNANPTASRVGDCTIRAISKATGQTWEKVYLDLALQGLISHDMPSANHVWGDYLESLGFRRFIIPNKCPKCYTVRQFATDHPHGAFILAISGHVVACIDGDHYDTWDSGDEIPVYFWTKEEPV